MMLKLLRFTLPLLVLLLAQPVATAAPISNGDFEAGSLSGWTIQTAPPGSLDPSTLLPGGYAAALDSASGYEAIAGGHSAFFAVYSDFYSFDPSAYPGLCDFDAWNIACPQPVATPSEQTGGPALTRQPYFAGIPSIAQDVDASAGDILSWTWRRYGEGDLVFASMTNGTTTILIGTGAVSFVYVDTPSSRSFESFAPLLLGEVRRDFFVLPEDGLWTIAFGVAHRGDSWIWSGFSLDDVQLRRDMDEPPSLALICAAMGLLAYSAKRRRS
jgi:hypothetical protein